MTLWAEPHACDEALARENARLRRELDVAQATIRDLRAALMPQPAIPAAFGLWPRQDKILAILLAASPRFVARDALFGVLYSPGEQIERDPRIVEALISRMRKRLAPFDIAVTPARERGYAMPAVSAHRLRAMIAAEQEAAL
jgi:DNA-binding response OmpR family regulator